MATLKVHGMVRLVRDPEIKQAGEKTICKFSAAANEKYKDVETSHFYNFSAFGKQGEIISKYFKKGSRIIISGDLKMSKWQNKEGKNQTSYEVVVGEFEFVDKKSDDINSGIEPNGNIADGEEIPF